MTKTVLTLGVIALMFSAAGTGCAAQQQRTMHVYQVGNSLTRNLTMDRLHRLMAQRGVDYQYAVQLAAGCPLIMHWEYRERPNIKPRTWETNLLVDGRWEPGGPDYDPNPKRFGLYNEALVNHKWDALVLQAYGRHMKDDLPAARNFIDFALKNGATDTFFLYATWPRRESIKDAAGERIGFERIDYQVLWEREYPYTEDDEKVEGDAYRSRDYYQKLIGKLNAAFPQLKTPVRVIPAGEVFYELDKRIKAGEIPGLLEAYERDPFLLPGYDGKADLAEVGVNIMYADGIHLCPRAISEEEKVRGRKGAHLDGNAANYVAAMTFMSVVAGENPLGLSAADYDLDDRKDAALIAALQQTVWDVVSNHPHTGLKGAR